VFLLVAAYPGSPGQKAVCVCVCVCVRACVRARAHARTYVQYIYCHFGFADDVSVCQCRLVFSVTIVFCRFYLLAV